MQPSNIPSILRKFDILLLLSKKKIETSDGGDIGQYTSPLKMFEYMASGRPIIASKLPVFEEVLKHNVNALLVSPDNDKVHGEALDLLSWKMKNCEKSLQKMQ
jgi:glycosyltransferase involved in cell wall biosynthesis